MVGFVKLRFVDDEFLASVVVKVILGIQRHVGIAAPFGEDLDGLLRILSPGHAVPPCLCLSASHSQQEKEYKPLSHKIIYIFVKNLRAGTAASEASASEAAMLVVIVAAKHLCTDGHEQSGEYALED